MKADKPNEIKTMIESSNDVSDLELAPVRVQKMYHGPDGPVAYLDIEENRYVFGLSESEAISMAFVASGCAAKAFFPSLYELLLRTLNDVGTTVQKVIIERTDGAIVSARLVCKDRKGRTLTCRVSAADAITFALYAKVPIWIVRNVIETLIDVDEWPFSNQVDSIWGDDDEDEDDYYNEY